jgi:holo-[acyl-carrier protein] synthase
VGKDWQAGVVGIGVDIIEVARMREALNRHPERFPDRVFTADERRYCAAGAHPEERYAVRYAAKEAVMKALGTGWARGVGFRDIEVTRGPDGAPDIRLGGKAAQRAGEMGVERIHLSLSHGREQAVAMVVLSGP